MNVRDMDSHTLVNEFERLLTAPYLPENDAYINTLREEILRRLAYG